MLSDWGTRHFCWDWHILSSQFPPAAVMLTWQGLGQRPSLPRCALPPLQPGEAAQFPQLGLRFSSGSAGLGQPALRGFPLDPRRSESRPTSKSAPGRSTPTLFNQAASFRLVTFPEKTEVERSHTKKAQRAGANLPRLKADFARRSIGLWALGRKGIEFLLRRGAQRRPPERL